MQYFFGRLFHFTDSTLHCRGKTCHFDLTVKNSPRVICQRQLLSAGAKHNFIKTSLFLLCAAAAPLFTARSAAARAIIAFLSAWRYLRDVEHHYYAAPPFTWLKAFACCTFFAYLQTYIYHCSHGHKTCTYFITLFSAATNARFQTETQLEWFISANFII